MSLLSQVRATPTKRMPPRMYLYAREKFGKSSFAANFPRPIFFMTKGETGLLELIDSGRVGPTPHFPYDPDRPPTFETLMQAVGELNSNSHEYQTLVVDTANGAESLCVDLVRARDFDNSQKKFGSYGKGWDACRPLWADFLAACDSLRTNRNMGIVFLAHTKRKKFNDPTGEDFDKYMPECSEKLWDLTHKWADIICFGLFESSKYETEDGRTKAVNRPQRRLLCFDQSPLWDAGNRYGLTGSIDVGGGAAKAYVDYAAALEAARGHSASVPLPTEDDLIEQYTLQLEACETQAQYDAVSAAMKTGPAFTPKMREALVPLIQRVKSLLTPPASPVAAEANSSPVPEVRQ